MRSTARLSERSIRRLKVACIAFACVPLTRLIWLAAHDGLGANPIEYITHSTGWWTLAFLMITLAITPIRRLTGLNELVRLRRTLGLCAFAYGLVHFLIYLWLDQFFDVAAIIKDIAKRPFITVGFAAFVLLVPLAMTSTNAMVRRLGGRRWQALHRCVYAVGVMGVTHYWWLVKKDVREPLMFAALLLLLMGARLLHSKHSASVSKRADSQVA